MGASKPMRIVVEEFDEDEEQPAKTVATVRSATTANRDALVFISSPCRSIDRSTTYCGTRGSGCASAASTKFNKEFPRVRDQ